MVRVKICGITNIVDAENALNFGADAIGFVFAKSPRKVSKGAARAIIREMPPFVTCVGLFVNEDIDKVKAICDFCNIRTLQLHGNEDQDYLNQFTEYKTIKAIRVGTAKDLAVINDLDADAFLLDSMVKGKMGGTGKCFDWEIIRKSRYLKSKANSQKRIIIAGGLTPDNVSEAINVTKPFGVDISSGVESDYGLKDKKLLRKFISEVKMFPDNS